MIKNKNNLLSIGEISKRTGLSVTAIRHYEAEGLISSMRNSGGQRRFLRGEIRRLSFILIAQQFGFSLAQIRDELAHLPNHRNPTKKDWENISKKFKNHLDEKIAQLTRLKENLSGCIGCGCLSLQKCKLYNPEDAAQKYGTGPRFVLEQRPKELAPKGLDPKEIVPKGASS